MTSSEALVSTIQGVTYTLERPPDTTGDTQIIDIWCVETQLAMLPCAFKFVILHLSAFATLSIVLHPVYKNTRGKGLSSLGY